jgi:hypothetical protein
MSFVQIKIEYGYYSNKRITLIFLNGEDISFMKYDFKTRILNDVPHFRAQKWNLYNVWKMNFENKHWSHALKICLEMSSYNR